MKIINKNGVYYTDQTTPITSKLAVAAVLKGKLEGSKLHILNLGGQNHNCKTRIKSAIKPYKYQQKNSSYSIQTLHGLKPLSTNIKVIKNKTTKTKKILHFK